MAGTWRETIVSYHTIFIITYVNKNTMYHTIFIITYVNKNTMFNVSFEVFYSS